ncbi:hypothetical protein [Prevotellamassilia timonensis]|uniref:hypothetical protein n=1 Tax=Prevotellamassilia timonensis TaxID=1852370 RepID=UPI00307A8201
MKKITFMLALLTASTTGAFAGTFTTSDDAASHVYAIKNVGAANGNYVCINGAGFNATKTMSNIAFFKVEAGSAEGQYYLYSVTNNKYVSYSGTGKSAGVVVFANDRASAKQWKIALESGQAEKYDISPVDAPNIGWNWVGGVGNQLGFWDNGDGASSWTFDAAINVTINYALNGTTVSAQKNGYALPGYTKETVGSPFVYTKVSSMSPETTAEGTTEYTINLAESLPFVKSENFDNAKWYLMDMHSNDYVLNGKNYMWTYVAADQDVTLPQVVMNYETEITDDMLWCFVGDVFNGFKIYNKAAGSTMTLRKAETGNKAAVMSATDDHNQFKLYPTTTAIANGFCFKLDGDDYYINTQKPDGFESKVLRGWNEADGGSTCRVFATNKFVADAARPYNNLYVKASELPAGAIGTNSYLEEGNNLETLKSQYAAATAEGYTTEQVKALAETMKKVNAAAANETTVEAGKYYRLYNAKDKKYLCVRATNNAQMTTDASMGKAVSSVVTFADAENGRFLMKVEGKTFGKRIRNDQAITLEEENSGAKGSYAVAHTGTTFTFYDYASNVSDRSYLHCNNVWGAGNVVGWDAQGVISPSYWHVIEATDVEIDMTTQGDKKYASAYLPFGVSNVAGATAYTGALNAEKNAIDMTATTAVPANTGFVLVGTADKATLTIGEADAISGTNALTGSNFNTALTDATRANYLVFGVNAGTVGFYTPSSSVPSIPANKAYINASAVAGSAIALNFGNTVTGINAATINNGENNAPIYDLSGRRVWAPVKGGLYIQNGKKLVK